MKSQEIFKELIALNARIVKEVGAPMAERIHEVASARAALDGKVISFNPLDAGSPSGGKVGLDFVESRLARINKAQEEISVFWMMSSNPQMAGKSVQAINEKMQVLKRLYAAQELEEGGAK